ncbi:hypothetical protein [Roseomonas sp. CECT 9278]|uniref:hypothetical protein n=1 Tax=Roseomonas sp. CECT 9278 TaxID=2845823 RepID=UPI001E56DAAE|nr:hypothetical protein [Roseomonas sp. CECT 9278]
MPRATRNPALSLWLSMANRIANAGRGIAFSAVRRQQATRTQDGTRAWTRLLGGLRKPRRKRS